MDFANSEFFGPLTVDSCYYFLFMSVFFFVILLIVFFSEVFFLFKNFKTLNFRIFMNGLLLLFNIFIVYFVNRLLFTMCNKSLH